MNHELISLRDKAKSYQWIGTISQRISQTIKLRLSIRRVMATVIWNAKVAFFVLFSTRAPHHEKQLLLLNVTHIAKQFAEKGDNGLESHDYSE